MQLQELSPEKEDILFSIHFYPYCWPECGCDSWKQGSHPGPGIELRNRGNAQLSKKIEGSQVPDIIPFQDHLPKPLCEREITYILLSDCCIFSLT